MALKRPPSAIEFTFRVEMQHYSCDVTPVGAFSVRVEQAQIGDNVLLVVNGQNGIGGRGIGDIGIERRHLHGANFALDYWHIDDSEPWGALGAPWNGRETMTSDGKARGHQTQWAAQFAVASELCKRGYEVAFTSGHTTPVADLMAVSPVAKTMFLIDVKSLYRPNPWLIKRKPIRDNLFYVLTFVPVGKPNEYFVLDQGQVYASKANSGA